MFDGLIENALLAIPDAGFMMQSDLLFRPNSEQLPPQKIAKEVERDANIRRDSLEIKAALYEQHPSYM